MGYILSPYTDKPVQPLKAGMETYSITLFSFPSKPMPLPAHTLMSRMA